MAEQIGKKKFIKQVRQRAYENRNGVFVPRTAGDVKTAAWPVCLTCKHDVDSVNVEDISTNVVTIRARCHDKESVIKMEFPFSIIRRDDRETWHHVQSAINNSVFFDPTVVG